MIKYFAVENFKSIKNECILELDLNLDKNSPYAAHPIIGFAGANASGKTNILKALTFVLWFMQHSFFSLEEGKIIPYEPFISQSHLPTRFHLIFAKKTSVDEDFKSVDYEYELSLYQKEVIAEKVCFYPYKRKRTIYVREGKKVEFGKTIKTLEQESLSNLRKNCSIISFAAQFASQETAREFKNYEFDSNIGFKKTKEYNFNAVIMKDLAENPKTKHRVLESLKIADVGIEDFESIDLDKKELKEISGIVTTFSTLFKHCIDDSTEEFMPELESSGTLKFLALLYSILEIFKKGGVLIVDEIELKLHQNLVAYVIGLFQNKYENINHAQLIFSFHNTAFMNILKPEQLWFTEKNDRGITEIFSAADFKDIKKLHERNLEELYRIGRFGAKPRGL